MKPFVSARCKRNSSIGHNVTTQSIFKFGTHFSDSPVGHIERSSFDISEQVNRKLREKRQRLAEIFEHR